MISHCLRHTACLTARVDVFCDHGHTLNHMIVVRISGRSWREPVLNLTSRKPNEQVRWLILGVATRMSHMPFDQDTESPEPPSSSVLTGWLVLGVELPLKTLSLWNFLRLLFCQSGWYLALQHNCHIDHTIKMLSLQNLHCLLYCLDGWYSALQHNWHIGNSIKTLSLWNFLLSFEFTLPAASTLEILAPPDA